MANYAILGVNGVLGHSLQQDLELAGQEVKGVTRGDLNILDHSEVKAFIKSLDRTTIVNCIAYMPADKCENNVAESKKINVDFVETLSSHISKMKDISLVQFSSDFIFDGKAKHPYTEYDEANPVNVYGQQKKESEKIVRELLKEKGKVVRFASLVGHSKVRTTFLEKIIDRAKVSNEISVVMDLKISTATSSLISKVIMGINQIDKPIIHAVHDGVTSWYDLAQIALDELGIKVIINPVSSDIFPTLAQRPMYSALKASPEVLGLDSRNWEQAVRSFVSAHLK